MIICCPNCGAEYSPSEIFIPKYFFGQGRVSKTEDGKIDFMDDMDLAEDYRCDFCKRKFHVKANLTFDTSYEEFDSNSYTKFEKPQLFMSED